MKKLTHASQFIAFFFFISLLPNWLSGQQIYINEFLASNSNVNVDEYGESDDWIELYNATGSSVNIGGMYLTDDLTNLTKWAFPAGTTISSSGFLLIWCDNQPAQGPLHTNFKLSASGEDVALVASNGSTILDSYSYGAQTANISLGRQSDGQTPWTFFSAPSPNASNGGAGSTIVAMPVASQVGGHYSSDFFVTLSTTTSGAFIKYTTDGSDPTASSSNYNSAIEIDETTTLRAKAFKSGMEPSRTMTHTYLYNINHTLPIFCLSTDDDNFFSEEDGIYENWSEDIEQPVHVELFEADGSFGFRQDLGVQVHGGFSQSYPHKGISFIARNDYGNNKINYPLFPDLPYDKYGSFILRASGNDWSKTMFRDALCSSLIREFDDVDSLIKDPNLETQAYRPAVVYLNGEYFGIHNLREKFDWRFLETHYGIEKNEADIVVKEDNLEHGELDAWFDFTELIEDGDFTDTDDLAELKTWVDITDYFDYFLLNIYVDNNDWPDNNNKRWRLRQDSSIWRYFVYDMDRGFGLIPLDGNYNSGDWTAASLEYVLSPVETHDHNTPWSTLLLRKLMDNDTLRVKFINRMADQLNIMYNADRVMGRIDGMADVYAPEIPLHSDKWWNVNNWASDVDKALLFAEHRDTEMWQQYDDYFDEITDVVDLTMNALPAAGGIIHLNTINLREANFPWEGLYFEGVDVPLYTVPNPGYIFSGWTPSSLGNNPITVMNLNGDEEITANFILGSTQIGDIVINEINYHSPDTCDSGDWIELFNAGTQSVDISGWFLEDGSGNYFNIPANTTLPGQGFLVLVEDAVRFQNVHPTITNFIAGFGNSLTGSMGLSNKGEWISINNADRSFMDTVLYDDKQPWPESPDGDGPTLQLINHNLDNALHSSWVASAEAKGTPGQPNQGVLYLGPNTVLCTPSSQTLDAFYEPCFNCTYSWNTGEVTSSISVVPSSGINVYAVTVTDGSGITQTDDLSIELSPPFSLSYTNTDLLCNNDNNAGINLEVNGTGSFTYAWTNGATTEDLNNLSVGDYTVTVTDALFCTQTQEVSITAPPVLEADGMETAINCYGELASVEVNVYGGLSPYSYLWSNGAVTDTIYNLPEGNYSLTVTDSNNCTTTLDYSFNEPTEMIGDFDIVHGCNGLLNGTIDVDMEGGTGDYYFDWSNGQSSSSDDLEGLGAGIYVVTVSDENNCTWIDSVEIFASSAMGGSYNISNILCPGDSNGAIDISINGGTTPYTYDWSNGDTTTILQDLSDGPYLVTVTDKIGCELYDSVYVASPLPVGSSVSLDDVSCYGGSDGAIISIGTGGTGTYNYIWSTGDSINTLNNLSAGNYDLTITDSNNCSNTFDYIIEEAPLLTATNQTVNVNCNGSATGEINISPLGGTAPYSYLWNTGATSSDLTNLVAGSYSVTITDDNNCSTTQNAVVTENSALVTIVTQNNLGCNNTPTGSIELDVSGAQAPYSYDWSNGEDNSDLNNLAAGTYIVTITDAYDCSQIQSITLTEPAAIEMTATETNVDCYGDTDGSISILTSGGNAPYNFLWNTGATSDTIINLAANEYQVTITDNNNCTTVQNATVSQPDALSSVLTSTNITCFGMNDGQINISSEGGTGSYSYLWSNGDNEDDLSSLPADSYTVTVTDDKGCTAIESVSISQPDLLDNSYQVTEIECNDEETGSIFITPTGGASPYSYLWNTDADTNAINNLGAATYVVTISDDNNCTQIESIELTSPTAISSSIVTTNNLCFGDNDGTIELTASGGTAPYDYDWSNGDNEDELNNLVAGEYLVTITDDNDCMHTATATITEPPVLSIDAQPVGLECFGFTTGTIDITPMGGTGSYTYEWNTGSNDQDLDNIGEGNYTVTVTDTNDCSLTETVNITEPPALSTNLDIVHVSCNGGNDGTIELSVNGGVSPYYYNWSNGDNSDSTSELTAGEYLVTITDDNGCTETQTVEISEPDDLTYSDLQLINNDCFDASLGSISLQADGGVGPYSYEWNTGLQQSSLSNLPVGNYIVTITDNHACTFTESFSITQPTVIAISMQSTSVSCYNGANGSIDLSISGGTGDYNFSWNTGADTEDLIDLSIGDYMVTVSDEFDCEMVETVSITQPEPIQPTITVTAVNCNGELNGAINLEVLGGTAPYTYIWNTGYDQPNPVNLGAGEYSVTILDNHNCEEVQVVTVSEPTVLEASSTLSDNLCNGGNNGNIQVSPNGGVLPYTYVWSNGASTASINGLSTGNYTVTITDGNSCTYSESFAISAPPMLTASWQTQAVSCYGGTDGSVNLTISGGVVDYNVNWSNGANTEDVDNLASGIYTATISDANNCITSLSSIIVGSADSMTTIATDIVPLPCNGLFPGSIAVSTTGGTAGYNYLWSTGDVTPIISTPVGGVYFVTVTDNNACTSEVAFEVTLDPGLSIANTFGNVSCFGEDDGYISIQVMGGTNVYEYDWSTGDTSVSAIDLIAGEYIVNVLDSQGCPAADTFIISEPNELIAVVNATDPVIGFDGNIIITPEGGTAPYSIEWNTGSTQFELNGINGGTYTYILTDDNGCITEGTVELEIVIGLPTITNADVSIYPNPSSGLINVRSDLNEMTVNVVDMLGRTLHHFTKDQQGPLWLLQMNDLETGVYYVHIQTAQGDVVKRLVIQK